MYFVTCPSDCIDSVSPVTPEAVELILGPELHFILSVWQSIINHPGHLSVHPVIYQH